MRQRFGPFVLDRGRRELLRGDDAVHISPKAFQLLELLVDAAPNALSRDQLYSRLWPDTFVEEANLPNLVKEIRKALDDDSRNPRYVKTLHGFGYAFNEVARLDDASDVRWSSFVLSWSGRDFPLRIGENVIGRDVDAAIRVDSAGVSRRHAVLTVDDRAITIRDLGSKNGTHVNGVAISASTPLAIDSEVRLGSAVMRVRRIGAAETTMTVTPAGGGES